MNHFTRLRYSADPKDHKTIMYAMLALVWTILCVVFGVWLGHVVIVPPQLDCEKYHNRYWNEEKTKLVCVPTNVPRCRKT